MRTQIECSVSRVVLRVNSRVLKMSRNNSDIETLEAEERELLAVNEEDEANTEDMEEMPQSWIEIFALNSILCLAGEILVFVILLMQFQLSVDDKSKTSY